MNSRSVYIMKFTFSFILFREIRFQFLISTSSSYFYRPIGLSVTLDTYMQTVSELY